MKFENHLRTAVTTAILGACLVLAACGERTNREDFVGLIKGKTELQVRTNAGKPASIDDQSSSRHVWTYTSRTFDVQRQNKTDGKTIVTFTPGADGKLVVSDVKFVE
jgi:hypothetical protein